VLSLADCPIPRASCLLSARLIPQSPPLLRQSVSEVLRSLGPTTRTEVDRFLEDIRVRGHAADFSVQAPNL